jgi:hypothetical protein
MKRMHAILLLAALAGSPVLAADRLTDKDVKALAERIDEGRDRFKDALDDKTKHSVLRGPNGEVDVSRFLDDFNDNIDKLKDRLKPEYSASSEAATVLRQASAIDAFFKRQPPGMRGESEWNRLTADFKTLAAAYGTTFPTPDSAPVRRVGDRELATSIDQVGKAADQLKKSLDNDLKKDTTMDKGARQAIVTQADQLAKDAHSVRDRVKDGKPSSAEADRMMAAADMQTFLDSHQVPASSNIWTAARPQLETVANAYGRSWPAK